MKLFLPLIKTEIFNLYKMSLSNDVSNVDSVLSNKAQPITNSLNQLEQLSLSRDGMKLIYTTLYKQGYNIFLINDPFNFRNRK